MVLEVTHYTRVKQLECRYRILIGKAPLVHWPIAVADTIERTLDVMNEARRDRTMDPQRRQAG